MGEDVSLVFRSLCYSEIEYANEYFVFLTNLKIKDYKNHKQDVLIKHELVFQIETKLIANYQGKKRKLWALDKKLFWFIYQYCAYHQIQEFVRKETKWKQKITNQ